MNLGAFYDGTSIENFSHCNSMKQAKQYLDQRYNEAEKLVIYDCSWTQEQIQEAKRKSIELAK